MKVVAILQARMSSSRLPSKVLMPILGKPMLAQQILRLQRAKNINQLIVATSNDDQDKAIAELCQQLEINCFTGSLDNVLDRFYHAAKSAQADIVVRLTGDCPLADPEVIDSAIELHLTEKSDYTSNCEQPTYPDGFDVEVFNFTELESAWQQATKPSELEHVTPYIRNKPLIKKSQLTSAIDYSHYRLTVDEAKDFQLVEQIYQMLSPQGQYFTSEQIFQLLSEKPELSVINQDIIRNEGYLKSLAQDQLTKQKS